MSNILSRALAMFLVCGLSTWTHGVAQDDYTTHSLSYGISIAVPTHWAILESDVRKNINLTGKAIAKDSGVEEEFAKETLIAANATPSPTNAMLRVSITKPSPFSQADIANPSQVELDAVKEVFEAQIKAAESHGGAKLVRMNPVEVTTWNGTRAMVLSYTRKGVDGTTDWNVIYYRVPMSYGLIEAMFSCRASDALIWKPILERVRKSMKF
jgi:hypothetical protein